MEFELLDNGKIIESIDFGRPDVGTKNVKILQLRNNSIWEIVNINLDVQKDDDVNILYPKSLKPKESGYVTITWNPKFERRTPLNISQMFTGDLLIG